MERAGVSETDPRLCNNIFVESGFQCAGCGEWNATTVDSSAGSKQNYVEDCQVCCKPNVLQVSWDMSAGEYTISAELE
jgi:hypothetical protein